MCTSVAWHGLARPWSARASTRRPSGSGTKWPFRWTRDHRVRFRLGHVDQHAVAQNAGVVHQHVELAELRDRLLDHLLGTGEVADVVAVGDRLATHLLDLVHDLFGRRLVATGAVGVAPEVIDDNLGAFRGKQQRMLPADASPGTRDDRNASLESP